MRRIRTNAAAGAIALILVLVVTGCSRGVPGAGLPMETGTAKVTGTVAYSSQFKLPDDAEVIVWIADVSSREASSVILGQASFTTEGRQMPLAYEVDYFASSVVPAHEYDIRATITSGGKVLFVTRDIVPVITHYSPTSDVFIPLSRR
jgi:putative lipoprotein